MHSSTSVSHAGVFGARARRRPSDRQGACVDGDAIRVASCPAQGRGRGRGRPLRPGREPGGQAARAFTGGAGRGPGRGLDLHPGAHPRPRWLVRRNGRGIAQALVRAGLARNRPRFSGGRYAAAETPARPAPACRSMRPAGRVPPPPFLRTGCRPSPLPVTCLHAGTLFLRAHLGEVRPEQHAMAQREPSPDAPADLDELARVWVRRHGGADPSHLVSSASFIVRRTLCEPGSLMRSCVSSLSAATLDSSSPLDAPGSAPARSRSTAGQR